MAGQENRRRPGAPRIEDQDDKRTVIIEFRASPREAHEIDGRARTARLSRSAYLRRSALGRKVRPVAPPLSVEAFEMAEAIAILGRALALAIRLDPPAVDPSLLNELRTRLDAIAAAIFAT